MPKIFLELYCLANFANTFNTDACDIEIEKEEKKKKNLRYRDKKETKFVLAIVRSLAKIVPLEPAPITKGARKNWDTDIERTTTDKFFFFSLFLRSGYGYEIWFRFSKIWLDWFLFRYLGYITFWFDILKFGVMYDLGLERAKTEK